MAFCGEIHKTTNKDRLVYQKRIQVKSAANDNSLKSNIIDKINDSELLTYHLGNYIMFILFDPFSG